MKKFILLLFVATIVFSSCEDTQDNATVIQATIDSTFFRANGAIGGENEDASVTLQGLTDDEVLTVNFSDNTSGTYTFNQGNNYAIFESASGLVYTTKDGGSGSVTVSSWDTAGFITGDFQFVAIAAGLDTIYVDKGIFYRVPFGSGETNNTTNAGSFSAQLDGALFVTVTVTAVDSGNSLLISGATASGMILLRLPTEVTVGNYSLPSTGFQATYSEGSNSENANNGNISVVSHDTAARTISGTFSFVTDTHEITNGQFQVTYE